MPYADPDDKPIGSPVNEIPTFYGKNGAKIELREMELLVFAENGGLRKVVRYSNINNVYVERGLIPGSLAKLVIEPNNGPSLSTKMVPVIAGATWKQIDRRWAKAVGV